MNKDDHYPPTKAAAASAPSPAAKREPSGSESAAGGGGGLFGKSRYKLWVLAAILLLAFWSMFTGTVTLKWSAGNLTRLSADLLDTAPLYDDLDILEVEEREKVVRHMWEAYIHTSNRLPRFWLEAFQAAYDSLASDVQSVRDAAVTEIAKLSLSSTFFSTSSTAAGGSSSEPQLPARSLKMRRARKFSR